MTAVHEGTKKGWAHCIFPLPPPAGGGESTCWTACRKGCYRRIFTLQAKLNSTTSVADGF